MKIFNLFLFLDGRMNSNASDVHRVAAGNLEKTIQDIKEIAGKHSDDDIYAMLKECNMDPNETAQRLLYLGKTFLSFSISFVLPLELTFGVYGCV